MTTMTGRAKAAKKGIPRAAIAAPPAAVKWRVDVEMRRTTPEGVRVTWEAVFDDDGDPVLFTAPDEAEMYALRMSAQDATMWLRVVPHSAEFKTFPAYNFGRRWRQHAITGVRLREDLVLTAGRDDAPEEAYYVVEHRLLIADPAQTQDVWRPASGQRYLDILDAMDAAQRLSTERGTHEFRAALNEHIAQRPVVYRSGKVALDIAGVASLVLEVGTPAEIDTLIALLKRRSQGVQTAESE